MESQIKPKSSFFEFIGGSRGTGSSQAVSANLEKKISFPPRPGCPSEEKKSSPAGLIKG